MPRFPASSVFVGAYDIAIANNGVIYKLNTMLAPDEYQSVMAPSSTYEDMQVMNYLVRDPSEVLNVGFKYYLLAMKSKYAFFVPDDNAFDQYFVDVTSLGLAQPKALCDILANIVALSILLAVSFILTTSSRTSCISLIRNI